MALKKRVSQALFATSLCFPGTGVKPQVNYLLYFLRPSCPYRRAMPPPRPFVIPRRLYTF